ncbi:MAG: cadmium-translocating P-type ATPase [Ruminococcaceae bacterium]|nr:cadmium-translocating P-type ATPase [Oscillospiraceae bacterium]
MMSDKIKKEKNAKAAKNQLEQKCREEKGCGCGHDHEHGDVHGHDCCCEHEHIHEHTRRQEESHCCDEHHAEEQEGCGCGCGHDRAQEDACRSPQKQLLRYGLGAIPVVIGFLGFLPLPIRLVASVAAYLLFGAEVWLDMFRGVRRKQIFTEFTLMCVASVGAFAIGEFADGAAVMYLYSLGETLSDGAYVRSKRSISELLAITPEYATVIRQGEPQRVSPESVAVGETILIVSGERIPLDGTVCSGGGLADTSSVTGEAKPWELYEGISCPSGSILTDGSVKLTVTATYENSVVAKLTRAVKEATARKSVSEKKIRRFAKYFTPCAFAVAALIALAGTLLTGEPLPWLRAALTVLVISCPCSLVLSVPLTYFAGIGAGASRGIILRGGEVIDSMCRLRAVAFDKTGTLTDSGLHFDGAEVYGEMSEKAFLSLSYAVLVHSPHAAAASFCRSYGGTVSHTVSEVENRSGRGILCMVDGKKAIFGNAALMREQGIALEDSPTTAIFGAYDGRLLGSLHFSSPLKEGTAEGIQALRKLGIKRIAVLSGDGKESVAEVCRSIGIEEYYASLTPAEKADRFDVICQEEKTRKKDATVAFCGDGLNDSAVIAAADVGIAMGCCGSALTVSSADVVLMEDDPRRVAEAITLSRRTSRIAGQNIVLSLGIKLGVLLIGVWLSAQTGEGIPMGLAVVADVGAALLAVLNALRAAKGKNGIK